MPFELEQNPEFHMGGGGLYSTAADYIKFCRMILNKGKGNGNGGSAAPPRKVYLPGGRVRRPPPIGGHIPALELPTPAVNVWHKPELSAETAAADEAEEAARKAEAAAASESARVEAAMDSKAYLPASSGEVMYTKICSTQPGMHSVASSMHLFTSISVSESIVLSPSSWFLLTRYASTIGRTKNKQIKISFSFTPQAFFTLTA